MAIEKLTRTKQYVLKPEIASRVMLFFRHVVDNGDGTISKTYTAVIHPKKIEYELNELNEQIGIYEESNLPEFEVSHEQLMTLFTVPVTLTDGTQTYVGEIISNFADQLIAKKIGLEETDSITTQHIDLTEILPVRPPSSPE